MAACIGYIHEELERRKVDEKTILNTELLCEESILKLVKCAPEGASVFIRVRRSFDGVSIQINAKGEAVTELSEGGTILYAAQTLENDNDALDTGLLILKANEDRIRYSHLDGYNKILIKSKKNTRSGMFRTMFALVTAIIIGLIFKTFVPESINTALCDYVFQPIKTMFISALNIIVGPVVFFSIATCISQFTNLSELGKIGAKVMGLYFLTTLLAVFVGMAAFHLINPGEFGFAFKGGVDTAEIAVNTDANTSILNTIINIVPSNLVKPFAESNTLQIIFLSILLGVAVGMIGSYSRIIKDLFEACNALFLTVTTMIAKLIPLAVFCSMFIMIIRIGADSMMAMLGMVCTDLLGFFCMMVIYGLLILFIAWLNPITFFKKNWEGMINAFALSSSNAAMPRNIQICTEKLGISPKVCNFSIPLGATINMDGGSVHFAVTFMFLAKLYGVEVPQAAMFSVVLTIILLSLGTPGVPGATLVCLGVLLQQVGVPIAAIGIVMGVDPLLDMFRTMSNTTGDMAVTLIVAKTEGLLDIKKFKS